MVKESRAEAKLGVGVETLWRALVKDLRFIIPKLIPNTVDKIELLHGNGGLGSVFLFHLAPGVKIMKTQKERIVELDETNHEFGLQLIEGILLKTGFSSFKTTFKLSSITQNETLVDIKVVYATQKDEDDEHDEAHMKEVATKPPLSFLHLLENFLLHSSS
ncbi:phytohormone-binding protein-like [Momordica charantia]|uniref:Phytohormone-binding protein-like n=1 Tax=Momordica charantia TaxID=3673 RepID=A0A6J1CPC8_MOMCH|nr:phytohormone-binding protein-like [Momordica charantia]XP_022142874.1 phytohormone-binding protein-like [Momordica charantia]